MSTEHRNIPDAERHEPKGISTATVGQVYRSNGSASGSWKDDVVLLTARLDDVSTASSVLIPIPVNSTVVGIKAVLGSTVTLADSIVTVTRSGDNAIISSFTITYSGSAEGQTVEGVIGNANLVASTNKYLKISSDGGSTSAAPLYITIKLKVTE